MPTFFCARAVAPPERVSAVWIVVKMVFYERVIWTDDGFQRDAGMVINVTA